MQLEINTRHIAPERAIRVGEHSSILLTPPINEDYWLFRVKLFEDQAIVGFPKFGTIGIGFAQEADWNTNLPAHKPAQEIYEHIKHNKKYAQISDEECLEAIRLIQETAK